MDRNSIDKLPDNMNVVSSSCRKFLRKYDVEIINMSDYTSCENCRHLNGDNQCEKALNQGRYNHWV